MEGRTSPEAETSSGECAGIYKALMDYLFSLYWFGYQLDSYRFLHPAPPTLTRLLTGKREGDHPDAYSS
jgi:hypothetical protein